MAKFKKYFYIILSLLVIAFFAFAYKLYSVDLGGTFTVAVPGESGEVYLLVYGIDEDRLTRFTIPKETLMDVAMQRGEWRMGSVWKLIESENLSRQILSNTIIKSLKVPVDAWALQEANSLKFLSTTSSLNLMEKIRLLAFASGVSKKNREEVDFSETSYLFEARFADGEAGYKRQSDMSSKLRHFFVSPEVAEESEKIEIVNLTSGSKNQINSILETLETLGTHILSVRDGELEDSLDCIVESRKNSETVKKISAVFGCEYINDAINKWGFRANNC